MSTLIESTNNPLTILAGLIIMALTALLRSAARLAGAALYAAGRTVSTHWRLLALLAFGVAVVEGKREREQQRQRERREARQKR